MPKPTVLNFEVSANLQKLIGEELISNEEMAFIELIKNAYDSGAKHVTITIHQQTLTEQPYITIVDDGDGISLDDFKRRYMFAGYSERQDEAASATRVPTGEKGIGRFASDKVGSKLTVITRDRGAKNCLRVQFDWDEFRNKKKRFNEIEIPYSYVDFGEELKRSGTVLQVRGLRGSWDARRIEELRDAIATLLNPFSSDRGFVIELNVEGTRPSSETIEPQKPIRPDYELQFRVTGNGQVQRKFRSRNSAPAKEWMVIPGLTVPNLADLRGRLLYYIKKPSRTLVDGLPWGVQLYRDGFLMQPFGSPISDRLGLVEKRAKRAGHAPLVPNRLFGFVEISRLSHSGIKDTTSRQAMLESADLNDLVKTLKAQTDYLEENLVEEVSKPNWRRSTGSQSLMLEQARLNSLGNLSVGIGHEIRQPLQTIISHSDAIELKLQELHVDDGELTDSIQKINAAVNRIDETISFIKQLATGDLEEVREFDVVDTVKKELKLTEAQNDDIQFSIVTPQHHVISTNQTTVIHVMANLLRNSVEAIRDVQDTRVGQIKVKLMKEASRVIIEVADNGVGIADEDKPKMFNKFNTKKTGGLGFGLTYCRTILESQGGKISFTSKQGEGSAFRVEIPSKAE